MSTLENDIRLDNIQIKNFKVYEELDLQVQNSCISIIGSNGSGKSSLLDAIHYLGLTKSYFNPIDYQNIRFGEQFFTIRGSFLNKDESMTIALQVEEHKQKVLKKNKTVYKRMSEHIGLIPIVMIAPVDLNLINGSSEERRRFVDQMLGQTNFSYIENLNQYQKVLSQRNAALKQFADTHTFNEQLLESFNEQLIPLGEAIFDERQTMLEEFMPVFKRYYASVSGEKEEASLEYESALNDNSFGQLLKDNLEKDRILQRTTQGIHKDDLTFLLEGKSMKRYGSQGQQKTYTLALKIANYHFLQQEKQQKPILLLDDFFDRLDNSRVHNLLELVFNEMPTQVFLTDTNAERIDKYLKEIKISYQSVNIEDPVIA